MDKIDCCCLLAGWLVAETDGNDILLSLESIEAPRPKQTQRLNTSIYCIDILPDKLLDSRTRPTPFTVAIEILLHY